MYLSEARLALPWQGAARLLCYFEDAVYERSSYCVGGAPDEVAAAAIDASLAALDRIDMRAHSGTHPTLGAVDHVSVHPLGETPMAVAAEVALEVAARLSARLPIMLYGAARPDGRSLAETRRATQAYFRRGQLRADVDMAGVDLDPSLGICCCGATPHVLNYNVRLGAATSSDQAAAVAAAVRSRGNADPLLGVEALALRHADDRYEVACNLLDAKATPPAIVLERARAAAAQVGARIEGDYVIGLTQDQMHQALIDGASPPFVSRPP